MNSADYTGTKEYRDKLVNALGVAGRRLVARDFQNFAHGIAAEIGRLDSELSEYQDIVFPRVAAISWASLTAKPLLVSAPASLCIRFNSPSSVAPWGGRITLLDPRHNNAFAAGCL